MTRCKIWARQLTRKEFRRFVMENSLRINRTGQMITQVRQHSDYGRFIQVWNSGRWGNTFSGVREGGNMKMREITRPSQTRHKASVTSHFDGIITSRHALIKNIWIFSCAMGNHEYVWKGAMRKWPYKIQIQIIFKFTEQSISSHVGYVKMPAVTICSVNPIKTSMVSSLLTSASYV